MEKGNVQFPPPAGDVDAMRFNNRTPSVQIPANIVIQRIAIEGAVNNINDYVSM